MEAKLTKAQKLSEPAVPFDVKLSQASSAAEAERIFADELLRREQDHMAGRETVSMEEIDRMAREILDEDRMVS